MYGAEVDLAVDAAGAEVAEVGGQVGQTGDLREHAEQKAGQLAGDLVPRGRPARLRVVDAPGAAGQYGVEVLSRRHQCRQVGLEVGVSTDAQRVTDPNGVRRYFVSGHSPLISAKSAHHNAATCSATGASGLAGISRVRLRHPGSKRGVRRQKAPRFGRSGSKRKHRAPPLSVAATTVVGVHPLRWLRTRDAGLWALRRAARTAIVMPALFALGAGCCTTRCWRPSPRSDRSRCCCWSTSAGVVRDRASAPRLAGTGRGGVRIPRHAGVPDPLAGGRWRWPSSVSPCCSRAWSARCSPRQRRRCCCPSSCPSPRSARSRRCPTGWPAGAWRRRPRSLAPSRCCGPRRCETRCAGPAVAACRALADAAAGGRRLHARAGGTSRVRRTPPPTPARRAVEQAPAVRFLATPVPAHRAEHRGPHAGPAGRRARLADRRSSTPRPGTAAATRSTRPRARSSGGRRGARARRRPARRARRAIAPDLRRRAGRAARRARRAWSVDATATCRSGRRPSSGIGCRVRHVARAELPRAGDEPSRSPPIAGNIDLAAAAERRSWLERLLGRQPDGVVGTVSAAARSAPSAHLEPHSVWLHNSLRGAVGLGARRAGRRPDRRAALVLGGARHAVGAALQRAEHRPERAARRCSARPSAFVIGARCSSLIGTDRTVLWILLPLAILVAGLAPAAISFAAGQAGVHRHPGDPVQHHPAGRLAGRAGAGRGHRDRLRGQPGRRPAVLAPRRRRRAGPGAGRGVRGQRDYLRRAVDYGVRRCDAAPPEPPAPRRRRRRRAAAASRRLDDAFRELPRRTRRPKPAARWPR